MPLDTHNKDMSDNEAAAAPDVEDEDAAMAAMLDLSKKKKKKKEKKEGEEGGDGKDTIQQCPRRECRSQLVLTADDVSSPACDAPASSVCPPSLAAWRL